jgi:hypothetical protein
MRLKDMTSVVRIVITGGRIMRAGCLILSGLLTVGVAPLFGACISNVDTRPAIPTPAAGDKIHQSNFAGQTLIVLGTGCFKLDQVTISMLKAGSPGNLAVNVYAATLDATTHELLSVGALLGTSDQVTASVVGATLSDVTIPFTAKPTLNGGSAYLFVVYQVGSSGSGTNYYELGIANASPYTFGEYCKSGDAGTTWDCPGNNVGGNPGSKDVRISICVSPCPTTSGCTLTQGAYKNQATVWPDNFTTLALGTTSYTQSQLLLIYSQPVAGNGLIQLAHQLITAKLNQMNGASVPLSVTAAIATADALIGNLVVPPVGSDSLPTSVTSSLTCTLDIYNSGCSVDGPPHCGVPQTCPTCTP